MSHNLAGNGTSHGLIGRDMFRGLDVRRSPRSPPIYVRLTRLIRHAWSQQLRLTESNLQLNRALETRREYAPWKSGAFLRQAAFAEMPSLQRVDVMSPRVALAYRQKSPIL